MNALDDRTLEALVDGELSESDRADVLRELDHSPDGWRRLALAFLEDQALRQTLASSRAPANTPAGELVRVQAHPNSDEFGYRPAHRARRWAAGLAACVACAFLLGTWTGRTTLPSPPRDAVVSSPPTHQPTSHQTTTQQVASSMPNLAPSTRKELERRGFSVNERPRVLSVRQDGRTIQVLVNEIELRYVGRHSAL